MTNALQVIPVVDRINKDPELYHDPEKFDPRRFLSPADGSFTGEGKVFKFGVGRRKCVGEHLARAVLFQFVANLINEFQFEFVDPEDGGKNPEEACLKATKRKQL